MQGDPADKHDDAGLTDGLPFLTQQRPYRLDLLWERCPVVRWPELDHIGKPAVCVAEVWRVPREQSGYLHELTEHTTRRADEGPHTQHFLGPRGFTDNHDRRTDVFSLTRDIGVIHVWGILRAPAQMPELQQLQWSAVTFLLAYRHCPSPVGKGTGRSPGFGPVPCASGTPGCPHYGAVAVAAPGMCCTSTS